MASIFIEYKPPLEFEALIKMINMSWNQIKKADGNSKHTQIIAIKAKEGVNYMFVNHTGANGENDIFHNIRINSFIVDKIICMEICGRLAITSYAFLQNLIEINHKNSEAEILVIGKYDFYTVKISSIID